MCIICVFLIYIYIYKHAHHDAGCDVYIYISLSLCLCACAIMQLARSCSICRQTWNEGERESGPPWEIPIHITCEFEGTLKRLSIMPCLWRCNLVESTDGSWPASPCLFTSFLSTAMWYLTDSKWIKGYVNFVEASFGCSPWPSWTFLGKWDYQPSGGRAGGKHLAK